MNEKTHKELKVLTEFSVDLIRLKHKAMDLVAATGNERSIDLRDSINDLINKIAEKGNNLISEKERLIPIITKEDEMRQRYE